MSKTNLLVISPRDPCVLRGLDTLRDFATVTVCDDQAKLESLAPDAEVILLNSWATRSVDFPKIWSRAASVRWMHSLSAGVERLLFPEMLESAVPLTNARGVFKRSLAEFAVLGILFHTKKVRRLIDNQRSRRWDNFAVSFANQLVMGVIGFGAIGRECAVLARGLGIKIHALRRNPHKVPADPVLDRAFGSDELLEMLKGIDVLLCAAPLTEGTHHLIGDAQFNVMKSSAIVVNVGRGPVIDEAALIRALESRRIAGASLDVFEHEPLPEDSALWGMENVLISPHCTDQTENPDWQDLSMHVFIENFHRYRRGEPLENVVDKKAGY
jgi:phosphoglycerate dehydrogenase-like enzyme